jgi:hypothetical protein
LDLSHWIDALNRIDDIFIELGPWIPVCGELRKEPSESDCNAKEVLARRVICSILRFLRMILKTGKEKRFFVCQEVHREKLSLIHFDRFSPILTAASFHVITPLAIFLISFDSTL